MSVTIALAGNPNSGKTTLFNALTGSNQFVGNWPGVTVEKKEGAYEKDKSVTITDLPGIYSLSPYTLEEVISRNYLLNERPDVILNIIDGTNLERNLYLTTQLIELGIPVVLAVNMIDVVEKSGDIINIQQLSKELGCAAVKISALKETGLIEAAETAIRVAGERQAPLPLHNFCGSVEHTLAHIEEAALHHLPEAEQRWYAIKLFERDAKVLEQLALAPELLAHIEEDIRYCEAELDDDAESIITNERYNYITSMISGCYIRRHENRLSVSEKIDRVVTNRWAALPIFAAIMFIVYFVSVTSVGAWATDWANDGLFGQGWRLLGIGNGDYEAAAAAYEEAGIIITAFEQEATLQGQQAEQATALNATAYFYDENGHVQQALPVNYSAYQQALGVAEPDPADYGLWIPGLPVLLGQGLEALNCAPWLVSLILDGIVAGVGAVLGFVPQMLVLFLFLAFLEACGYMARIAFIMDRIFRKFGLSGKSFIPILIGTGCGVPGIMASRTIENDKDRKMTIITTTFIPCGAKLPLIALIAGAMFDSAWWVAPTAYFIGIGAIMVSGIMLKKTRLFAGQPSPFVMELPAYHLPTATNVLRSMWERGWSFIKKAGTIILLASIIIWFAANFGWQQGGLAMVGMNDSLLAALGNAIAPLFAPLGWGNWQSAVAAITGLVAKENVVSTFGVLFGGFEEVAESGWQVWAELRSVMAPAAGFSFLIFNLLCAPCFAAMGAIRREMNNGWWTAFAISYQCLFAYAVALCIYQFTLLLGGAAFSLASVAAIILTLLFFWLLLRRSSNSNTAALKEG